MLRGNSKARPRAGAALKVALADGNGVVLGTRRNLFIFPSQEIQRCYYRKELFNHIKVAEAK
ncbi:hypothetical protein CFter6_4571 [Collimonas fungivorans]|uniref:Uncharacterized protein n=1 Tax=Collimonas fungivorans TaxID=158899 RepID=A0A127PIB2_9BURK|nr:hypothetical protein CFter6_4571 [Collimonas fungivorans]